MNAEAIKQVSSKLKNLPDSLIEEVEKYIAKNGHLKNVPSAKEITKNGLELGEMIKIQQEKIEELKDSLNKKILGTDIKLNRESLKDYDILKIENKSFNSGNLINSVNIFYLNNKLQKIKNQEFFINSTDNGKTYDKSIYLVKNSDTVYYEIK